MKKIVKVEYSDKSILELKDIKPLDILESDSPTTKLSKEIKFNNQFLDFEEMILRSLNQENIETYAEFKLDMVKEEDIIEKTLKDFSDDEIFDESLARESFGGNKSIIAADFLKRFIRILDSVNPEEIDRRLTKMENKFKVI